MSRSSNIPAAALSLRILLWLLAFVTITPFLLLLLTSIKSKADVLKGAFALPAYPHFENYLDAWNAGHFNIYFWNSIIVVIPVVAASVFLGLLTALSVAVDFFATVVGAKRVGASGKALLGAAVGTLAGLFFGPIGLFAGPFVGALLGELWHSREIGQATKVRLGTWLGIVLGVVLKLGLAFAMLGLFLFAWVF